MRVGLTGGIGAGKSTVAELFHALGVPIFDADHYARRLVMPGQPALTALVKAFGDDILTGAGELDRHALRAKAFRDTDNTKRLNAILHPGIDAAMSADASDLQSPYHLWVVPLLVETHWMGRVDRILVVEAPLNDRREWVLQRDKLSAEDFARICARQADDRTRRQHAHDILLNDGPLIELRAKVEALHNRYLKLAQRTGDL